MLTETVMHLCGVNRKAHGQRKGYNYIETKKHLPTRFTVIKNLLLPKRKTLMSYNSSSFRLLKELSVLIRFLGDHCGILS